MIKQQSTDSYFISESILYRYQAKKILGYDCTFNQIIFITQSHLCVLNSNEPNKLKINKSIQSQNIISWRVSKQNHMCILYSDGILEIRNLQRGGQVINKFNYHQQKAHKSIPQLYWEDQDIFILYQTKLQLLNIGRKQRKTYSDLVVASDGYQAKGLVQSSLIDRERIIIMQFPDKLTLNIVPIPITEMPIKNVTKMLTLSYPKSGHSSQQSTLSRQYLILVIQNKILQVYNIISMKQIFQIQYQNSGQQTIKLVTDRLKQMLLVTFVTKKNKVVRNLLYKINGNEYYKGKDYFRQVQDFFQFEIQIDLKQHIMLFPSRQLLVQNNKFVSVDLSYVKHYNKRSKGQVVVAALIINPSAMQSKFTSKHKTKSSVWKQLREWKDIITSYIQMKNSLDQFDFGFDQQEEQQTLNKYISKPQVNLNESPIISKTDIYNIKDYTEMDKKIIEQFNKDTLLLQQHEKQMQKYEKLKNSLLVGAHKFQSQGMTMKIGPHQDHDKKLQQEFYRFMRQYLKQQQIDIDPQTFFQFQIQNTTGNKQKPKSSQQDKKAIQQQLKNDLVNIQKQLKPNQRSKTQNSDKQVDNKKTQERVEKGITQSRSTQKLTQNISTSQLNRTKSSANQICENNNNSGFSNPRILSCLSDEKNQENSEIQDNIENQKDDDFASENSQQQRFNSFTLKLTEAIGNVFKPFQDKLQKLDKTLQRIQSIHVNQLKKCQKVAQKQQAQLNNIDMKISGYCQELMTQFQKSLQTGIKVYFTKIQQIDKKANKSRDKAINDFGLFIDKQIKSREQIFDHNRICIENSLTHIRKKLTQVTNYNEEENDSFENDDENQDQIYNQKNLDHLQSLR